MSQQNVDFTSAVREVLAAVMFENWLRFYFITEKPTEPDKLFISVPERAMQRLRELHPFYMPMVEEMNDKEIDFETSRRAIATFVALHVEGRYTKDRLAEAVFDSNTFQNELQIFNTWVQAHEAQLDQGFLDFSAWTKLFNEWRNSKEVLAYLDQAGVVGAPGDSGNQTVQ